jgi:hypothetical protein
MSPTAPDAEVLNVSAHGFWLWVTDREFFLPFAEFPWFREATIAQIARVELLHGTHLHWPELDVDLDVESLAHRERFPLFDSR